MKNIGDPIKHRQVALKGTLATGGFFQGAGHSIRHLEGGSKSAACRVQEGIQSLCTNAGIASSFNPTPSNQNATRTLEACLQTIKNIIVPAVTSEAVSGTRASTEAASSASASISEAPIPKYNR